MRDREIERQRDRGTNLKGLSGLVTSHGQPERQRPAAAAGPAALSLAVARAGSLRGTGSLREEILGEWGREGLKDSEGGCRGGREPASEPRPRLTVGAAAQPPDSEGSVREARRLGLSEGSREGKRFGLTPRDSEP